MTALLLALWAQVAGAAPAAPPPAPAAPAPAPAPEPMPAALPTAPPPADEPAAAPDVPENDSAGYTANETAAGLVMAGYVDVGFAKAQGDGSSFPAGPLPFPRDYQVDAFAPAVNSRGDVAAIGPRDQTNGFLPFSAGIGGRPSFLLNTLSLDTRYQAPAAPVLVFARLQAMPRVTEADGSGGGRGVSTRVIVEQAFGRIMPFSSQELALFVGRFDSVFGIEYLENQANLRTGITPSLLARYTTGPSLGAKLLWRVQVAPLWSAFSINASATNSGAEVEALAPAHASLAGEPVLAARLGYELNLPRVQIKLGGSALLGPRADQPDRDARQRSLGADLRLYLFGLSLSGEYLSRRQDEGGPGKVNGNGAFPGASEFEVEGFWTQASYAFDLAAGPLRRITPYARFGHRHAYFEGATALTLERITSGLRIDLWDTVALKGEWLKNLEREGAPEVDNDVYTSSLVFSW